MERMASSNNMTNPCSEHHRHRLNQTDWQIQAGTKLSKFDSRKRPRKYAGGF